MSGKKRIYIAGPNLFYANWPTFASQAQTLCAEHGLEAILPVPATVLTGPGVTEPSDAASAKKVSVNCRKAVSRAHGVIANLSPFRGTEPDSGTVVEYTLAHVLGIPVIGFTSGVGHTVPVGTDEEGRLLASDGGWIEQFGIRHNVMVQDVCDAITTSMQEAVILMAGLMEKRKLCDRKASSVGFWWNKAIQEMHRKEAGGEIPTKDGGFLP